MNTPRSNALAAPLWAGLIPLVVALATLGSATQALAQANANPPERMTYQGFLTDANGVPLGNTAPKNYDVIFRIWKSESSTAAADRLWTEQQTVTVDKGYFSVLLGEGGNIGEAKPNLSTVFTGADASDRWVGITVKGIGAGGADATILPRLRMLTSPYSYLAQKAISVDGAALTSGTVADTRLSGNVALRAGGNNFTGNQTITSGNVGIGTGTPSVPLDIFSSTTWRPLSITGNGGTDRIVMGNLNNKATIGGHNSAANAWADLSLNQGGGKVGIGTASPGSSLDVAGGIRARGGGPGASGVGNNGYAFSGGGGDNDSGMFSTADGLLQFFSNNGERMRIDGSGRVGIGTTSPTATLDVNGTLRASGGVTVGSGGNTVSLRAPTIIEEISPNEQATWTHHWIDLSPWSDKPGGFKIRIYAQHELAAADYEVRNYEATVVFEKDGFANNPQFPNQVYRISFSWTGNIGRQSMKLGEPARTGGGGTQEIYPDGWFKICNYLPNTSTGGTAPSYSYYGLNKYVVVVFHPHVSGQIVISDN